MRLVDSANDTENQGDRGWDLCDLNETAASGIGSCPACEKFAPVVFVIGAIIYWEY